MTGRPLRIPAFRRLLGAYAVSQLGDWTAEVGLSVLVFGLTRSAAWVAVTWLIHRCLLGLATPLVVARVEHRRRERVVAGVLLCEAVLFAALAVEGRALPLAVLLGIVAADGMAAPVARALVRGSIVDVTRPVELLAPANAAVNAVFTANALLAPAAGGVLVAAAGASAALALNASSFVIAALALAGGHLPAASSASDPDDRRSARARLGDAMRFVRRRPPLGGMLLGHTVFFAFATAICPVEVALVTGTLHAGSDALGVVLAAWGAGMVAGGAAQGRLRRIAPVEVLLLGGCAAQGVACVGMGLASGVCEVVAWSIGGGIGNGVFGALFLTALQQRTPDRFQARVSALDETSVVGGTGAAFGLSAVLSAVAGPRLVYLVAGAGCNVVVAVAAGFLRRSAAYVGGRHAVPADGAR